MPFKNQSALERYKRLIFALDEIYIAARNRPDISYDVRPAADAILKACERLKKEFNVKKD